MDDQGHTLAVLCAVQCISTDHVAPCASGLDPA